MDPKIKTTIVKIKKKIVRTVLYISDSSDDECEYNS